jgi:hypothetical protein
MRSQANFSEPTMGDVDYRRRRPDRWALARKKIGNCHPHLVDISLRLLSCSERKPLLISTSMVDDQSFLGARQADSFEFLDAWRAACWLELPTPDRLQAEELHRSRWLELACRLIEVLGYG